MILKNLAFKQNNVYSPFFGYNLSMEAPQIDPMDSNTIRLEAAEVKTRIVHKHRKSFIASKSNNRHRDLSNSILENLLHRNPFGSTNTSAILAFNRFISSEAFNSVLKSKKYTVDQKIELNRQIIETSAREFFDLSSDRIHYNLTSSKAHGYFFTPFLLAKKMAQLGLKSFDNCQRVVDPSCGVGTLLAACMVTNPRLKEVVGIELDPWTAALAQKQLNWLKRQLGSNVKVTVIKADALQHFSQHIQNSGNSQKSFDLLIMNPPYGQVRHLSSDLTDLQTKAMLTRDEHKKLNCKLRSESIQKANNIRKLYSAIGAGSFTPEISKIFLGISPFLVGPKGRIVAITPSSWLSDKSGLGLRRHVLATCSFEEIWLLKETAKLFDTVNQPTAVISMKTSVKRKSFELKNSLLSFDDIDKKGSLILTSDISRLDSVYLRIPKYGGKRLRIFKKIHGGHKVIDLPMYKNFRGELDLTLHKSCVQTKLTDYRVIRGDHINKYILNDAALSKKDGYVDFERFLPSLGKSGRSEHIKKWRIACPQCSYAEKSERLQFCLIPPNHVLGNSCNYIIDSNSTDNAPSMDLLLALAILNSEVIDWEFRCYSSNNHVANYEIDQLHFPMKLNEIKPQIGPMVREMLSRNLNADQFLHTKLFIDAIVANACGLTYEDFDLILSDLNHPQKNSLLKYFSDYVDSNSNKNNNHLNPSAPNHGFSSLSLLDTAIISHIPQGGNWQNVPPHIPSKRLQQIREMSKERGIVRTSYYGRLRPEQPAYTIATYFNRPGNGTNIHPWENRTISCREAARLQSFPDKFIFSGSEASVRDQIGNAVPPLLAYAVGKSLMAQSCVDLFAGAGGLSLGLEMAGVKILAAQDIDKNAAKTYRSNHDPKTVFIEGDITDGKIFNELVACVKQQLGRKKLGLLVGGPPCQGFSTAGWRLKEDKRNALVSTYLRMAQELQPEKIVIENVEGLLSMEGGKIVRSIQQVLGEIGYSYDSTPWVLKAEQYGVPQMRRRVFIVAVKKGLRLPLKPEPIFSQCHGRREGRPNKEVVNIERPYPITSGEAIFDLPKLSEEIYSRTEYMKSCRPDYYEWVTGKIDTQVLISRFKDKAKIKHNTLFNLDLIGAKVANV